MGESIHKHNPTSKDGNHEQDWLTGLLNGLVPEDPGVGVHHPGAEDAKEDDEHDKLVDRPQQVTWRIPQPELVGWDVISA